MGQEQTYRCDLLVIGGGINGAGIARDAAGRGLSVILCEKDDLASHTSSASSKLIHGGLRYLEYYEFALVRKALKEREDLMRLAPHAIQGLRLIMPYVPTLRPRILLRLGLFLYDHLAPRQLLAGSRAFRLQEDASRDVLKPEFDYAFEYSDAWVDDARLVVLNALDAALRGARIWTRTICEELRQDGKIWRARLRCVGKSGSALRVEARAVVNASGAWASQIQQTLEQDRPPYHLRLVKGSHIVVKRLFEHERAYLFQHSDGRIVFALPFQQHFTLIGTTDIAFDGDLDQPRISEAEQDYLCDVASHYFRREIRRADICWSFAGIRPLIDEGGQDAKALSRDYRLEFDAEQSTMLHVFGGKITTYRRLAEEAMDQLCSRVGWSGRAWTRTACLPGGDLYLPHPDNQNVRRFPEFIHACQARYAFLDREMVRRMAYAYGRRIERVLEGVTDLSGMGEAVLPGLYACEIDYLLREEFAWTADDILWRRTKLGLHLPPEAAVILQNWLDRRLSVSNHEPT